MTHCAGAPSPAPALKRKQSRMSVIFNDVHDVPHDDEIGVETSWHDLHGGSFHRLSKKHKEHLHRRLSSKGTVLAKPTDISTHLLLSVMTVLFYCFALF